jgi:hypothetical protein
MLPDTENTLAAKYFSDGNLDKTVLLNYITVYWLTTLSKHNEYKTGTDQN